MLRSLTTPVLDNACNFVHARVTSESIHIFSTWTKKSRFSVREIFRLHLKLRKGLFPQREKQYCFSENFSSHFY